MVRGWRRTPTYRPFVGLLVWGMLGFFLLGLSHRAAHATDQALLLVGPEVNQGVRDQGVLNRLELSGLNVVLRQPHEVTSDDLANTAVILISSTVQFHDIDPFYTDIDIPLITWEPLSYDTLRLTRQQPTTAYATRPNIAVQIVAPDSPLAAGLNGDIRVSSQAGLAVSRPASSAHVVAMQDGRASLFAYLPGDNLSDGRPAPSCRVAFPGRHNDTPLFTYQGWALFEAAVEWSVACGKLPFHPLYRIPVRVHVGASSLPLHGLLTSLAEVNWIWRQQASICFEFDVVQHDDPRPDGFDIYFKPELGRQEGYGVISGMHWGDHDMRIRDIPDLYRSPPAVVSPGARTTSHEFGHALGLQHDVRFDDLLMRSGYQGIRLQPRENRRARLQAATKAFADTIRMTCGAPVVP